MERCSVALVMGKRKPKHNRRPPRTREDSCNQRRTTTRVDEKVGQPGPPALPVGLNNGAASSVRRLNPGLPCDPDIPVLGVCPAELRTLVYTGTCEPMFTAALFVTAPKRKRPQCPSTDKWIRARSVSPVRLTAPGRASNRTLR